MKQYGCITPLANPGKPEMVVCKLLHSDCEVIEVVDAVDVAGGCINAEARVQGGRDESTASS